MTGLEEGACPLHGKSRFKDVDEAQLQVMKEKCKGDSDVLTPSAKVDLASSPPCKTSLEEHIHRVNYQVTIWKKAHFPDPHIPSLLDNHGWTASDDKREPLWSKLDSLPSKLVHVLESAEEDSIDDEFD